jgi:hypothetical protein
MGDFTTNFLGQKFIMPNTDAVKAGVMGQKVVSVSTQGGMVDIDQDVFMQGLPFKTLVSPASSSGAPVAPTVTGAAAVAVDTPFTKWAAADAGSYFYAVSGLNSKGESTLTLINAVAVAIIIGGSVDLTFAAGVGLNLTTGFRIYRSDKNAAVSTGTFYPVFDVSILERIQGFDGALAGVVRDRNYFLPNTSQAMLFENSLDVLEFKKLSPLTKFDLATVTPSYRFLLMLYGTPLLYNHKRLIRFINIKN